VLLTSLTYSQISTFPYTQSFDSVAAPGLPSGWSASQNRTPGTNDFITTTSTPHSPPNAVLSTNATIEQSLLSPMIDFRAQMPDRMTFYTRRSSTHLARVVLEASLDSGSTFPIQIGDSLTNSGSTNYVFTTFALPGSLANRTGVRFRWRVVPDVSGNTGTFRIDDVTLTVQAAHDLALAGLRFIPNPVNELDTVSAIALVKNMGLQEATSFEVKFYVDLNNDSLPQPAELIATAGNSQPVPPGDSTEISAELGSFYPGSRNIIGQVAYVLDQNPSNDQLLILLRIGYRPFSVVVNEIMYAPTNTEPEWIELFNTRSDSINIKDWLVSDNNVVSKKLVTSSDLKILPGSYLVLTKDSAALLDVHPNIPSRVVDVPGLPTLNNSGDAIVLYDNLVATMDSLAYQPNWGGNTGGRSLERIDPLGPSTMQVNWNTSRHIERSTPGRRNSISRKDYDLVLDTLLLSPSFPIHGDSVVVRLKLRNAGFQQATSYALKLFDDLNNDSLPQPGEQVYSILQSVPLAPLDSFELGFPPLWPARNDQALIGLVSFSQDEDSSNNKVLAHARIGYRRGSIVISEIMYSPIGEPEWVEFYNATAESVDVKDWKISNRSTSSRYTIAGTSLIVSPHAYAVVAKDTALLLQHYVRIPGVLLQVPALPTFLFNNSGDAAVFFDNRDMQIDSVKYAPTWGGNGGTSLERLDMIEASTDSSNWASSTDSMWATPGRENSVAIVDSDLRALKQSALITPPGMPAALSLTAKNVGRMPSADFDVAFFDDLDRDSVAGSAEIIVRVHISQSLARGETLRVVAQWLDPPPGNHNVIALVEYAPDLRLANNSTIFNVKVGYDPRVVVVNEIMFAPFTGEAEYVELANIGTLDVDLTGWKLSDLPSSTGIANEFQLVSHGRLLCPGEFFVIASDSSIFSRFPGLDTMHYGLMTVVNQSSLGFNNDGDAVIIRDATLSTIDSVSYLPAWHNPTVTDATGRSLEKIQPILGSTNAHSWSTCVLGVGGTPGARNSIFTATLPGQAQVSGSPNPFSPDGDGLEDFTVIHCDLPTSVATVSLKIYDVKGRLIRYLVNSEPGGAGRDVVWDGYDDDRQRARVGIYILLLEGLNESGGNAYSAKGVVVLAAKL
jgi:hypothetical protein